MSEVYTTWPWWGVPSGVGLLSVGFSILTNHWSTSATMRAAVELIVAHDVALATLDVFGITVGRAVGAGVGRLRRAIVVVGGTGERG